MKLANSQHHQTKFVELCDSNSMSVVKQTALIIKVNSLQAYTGGDNWLAVTKLNAALK